MKGFYCSGNLHLRLFWKLLYLTCIISLSGSTYLGLPLGEFCLSPGALLFYCENFSNDLFWISWVVIFILAMITNASSCGFIWLSMQINGYEFYPIKLLTFEY